MSRSGYSEDLDHWAMIRWRGAVSAALNGKRGQAFLREFEAALVALPEKSLVAGVFATETEVCALGAVSLSRGMAAGATRKEAIAKIMDQWPGEVDDEYAEECGEDAAKEFGIANAMAREIMSMNDDYSGHTGAERYKDILKWVRRHIKKPTEAK